MSYMTCHILQLLVRDCNTGRNSFKPLSLYIGSIVTVLTLVGLLVVRSPFRPGITIIIIIMLSCMSCL